MSGGQVLGTQEETLAQQMRQHSNAARNRIEYHKYINPVYREELKVRFRDEVLGDLTELHDKVLVKIHSWAFRGHAWTYVPLYEGPEPELDRAYAIALFLEQLLRNEGFAASIDVAFFDPEHIVMVRIAW